MKTLRRMWNRLAATFAPKDKRADADLAAEFESHVSLLTEKNISRGMSPAEARRAAFLRFGALEPAKENYRDQRGFPLLDSLRQDFRYALRGIRRRSGFTAVIVACLALGIGANTAIFSIVDRNVLRLPPYRDAQRIVYVVELPPHNQFVRPATLAPLIDEQRRFPELLSQISYIGPGQATITGVGPAEEVTTSEVSSSFFSLLGWRPALGRDFVQSDENAGETNAVILSDALWHRTFGGNHNVIGRVAKLDGVDHIIVGVMPPDFINPMYTGADLWLPQRLGGRQTQWIARIAGSADLEKVRNRLTSVEQALDGRGPDWNVRVRTLHDEVTGGVRDELFVLLACAGFVLLLACANVANLMLARGAARRLEFNIRVSLGAKRTRLVRQVLTESLLLAFIGGAAGLVVAYWMLKFVGALAPFKIGQLEAAHLDARVFAFNVFASILTALLFGSLPAIQLSRVNLASSLRESAGAGSAAGLRNTRSLRALVGSEVALALMLTFGASLMARTFLHLRPAHPGFDTSGKTTFMIRPAPGRYPTAVLRQQFIGALTRRIESTPGVATVAIADYLPLSGMVAVGKVFAAPRSEGFVVNCRAISPNYFDAMAIPILSGRPFSKEDVAGSVKVAIVNRAMAETMWPGEIAVGKRFTADYKTGEIEVIGVAQDTREASMSTRRWLQFYVPYSQTRSAIATFIVTFKSDASTMIPIIRRAVSEVDEAQPLLQLRTVEEIVSGSVSEPRFEMYLIGSFAVVALLLAAVGIFGVISYSMRLRTRELCIRAALGASSPKIILSALSVTTVPVVLGLIVGWLTSLWLSRFMSSLLSGIRPSDAAANFAAMAIVCVMAAIASYLPARRATRVDPVVALRSE